MRIIRHTTQFKKDVKRVEKQGRDLERLKVVLQVLLGDERLAPHYRDHVLVGQYKGTRECHIEPDWLLIYELTKNELVLIRTGSHSDLFK